MLKLCWIVTMLGACAGMLCVINLFMSRGISAPQEAAGAAIACAMCVVPYVFTRAIEGMRKAEPVAQVYADEPRDGLVDPREFLSRGR